MTARGVGLVVLLVLAGVAGPPRAAAALPDPGGLDVLRAHWLAAVEDAARIDAGLEEEARIRAAAAPAPGSALDGTLNGYRGALMALRAKHAAWPHQKLRHLRSGLAMLDDAVTAHPRRAELRYLRLMTCYYLPGILGRGWSVREDFQALAELLPEARGEHPPEVHQVVVRFVLDHAELDERRRAALLRSLEAAGG